MKIYFGCILDARLSYVGTERFNYSIDRGYFVHIFINIHGENMLEMMALLINIRAVP